MSPTIHPLNPNPSVRAAPFQPPPVSKVTLLTVSKQTFAYWKTIRVAWFAGYRIGWVIPGRGGLVSGSRSFWNLDVRIQPEEEKIPARTARYSLEPYVVQGGRPYVEPQFGTRLTVKTTLRTTSREVVETFNEAPTGLGETARWLPEANTYVDGVWTPQEAVTTPPDEDIHWTASENNAPVIDTEFTYGKRGQWITTTSMSMGGSNYLRLDGMPLTKWKSAESAFLPITLFVVAGMTAPTKYWGSVIRAVESDGSSQVGTTLLDLRLMPDGNLHPYTQGWQYPLPLIGESHVLSMFGFTLDPATDFFRLFTIDKSLRISDMSLYSPHSETAKFVLGRSAEAEFSMDVLDILMYRGPMDEEQIEQIASELDAAYGITARLGQEQG